MKPYLEALKNYIEQNPPNYGEAESILGMLYKCHNEHKCSTFTHVMPDSINKSR